MTKEYQKQRRDKFKKLGLCLSCGKKEPEEGHSLCLGCKLDQRKRQQKHDEKVRNEAKTNNFCLCGRDKPLLGLKICEKCRKRNYQQYRRRKQLGICECSCLAIPGKTKCENCFKKYAGNKQQLRKEAMVAYGGPICTCCKETIDRFLTIDHINNDGNQHRLAVKSASIYRWLKKNNYPPGFQVLCFNCNMGRYLNGGVCPHNESSQ